MASSPEINQWNEGWRSSPAYAEILRSVGVNPEQPFKLSDQQRKAVQQQIESKLEFEFPGGIEIDPAGNMNENEGFGKQAKKWGPIVAAAAVTAFGIPGVMPGLFGGVGVGGGTTAATTAGTAATGSAAPLASYGPSAAMQAANMGMSGLPSVAATASGAVPALAQAAGGGKGWFDRIGGFLRGNAGEIIGAVGSGMQGKASADAHNRGLQFEADLAKAGLEQQAERDFQSAQAARERQAADNRTQAFKQGQLASIVYNDQGSKPIVGNNPYGRDVAAPSQSQKDIAGATGQDMLALAKDPYRGMEAPQRVGTNVSLPEPGWFEKWGGIIGAGATAGTYLDQMKKLRESGVIQT